MNIEEKFGPEVSFLGQEEIFKNFVG